MIMEWDLDLQFLQMNPRQPVTQATVDIDWGKPQFRISGAGGIPAYTPRPGARAYSSNRWYNLDIQYA